MFLNSISGDFFRRVMLNKWKCVNEFIELKISDNLAGCQLSV